MIPILLKILPNQFYSFDPNLTQIGDPSFVQIPKLELHILSRSSQLFLNAGVVSVQVLVAGKEAQEVFATGGANSLAGHSIIISTGSINHSLINQSIIH